jgi:hypothetical protein
VPLPEALLAAYAKARQETGPQDWPLIDNVVGRIRELALAREPLPWGYLAALLAALLDDRRDKAEIRALYQAVVSGKAPADVQDDLVRLLGGLLQPVEAPAKCRPVDLAALADGVDAIFDPTRPDSSARTRVLGQFAGLDSAAPTAPPELCPRVDLPTWRFLNELAPDWLLPGVATLKEDRVVAMETNPIFMESFLVGLNGQLLAELRWRNIPIASGCTPMRVFWDRTNTAGGERVDDLRGVSSWDVASALGNPRHRPDGVGGADPVLVFRGQLFLRYPQTLLYLLSAEHEETPDFGRDPEEDAVRLLPTFQGRIGSDVTFFGFQNLSPADIGRYWIALEEPPAGYRFYNNVPAAAAATNGADFAKIAFANPVRVLISGADLVPGDGP